MPRRYYSSTAARTTLASGVNNSATSFSVVAVSGWPESFPYTLIIDQDTVNEEIVQVTARSGTSLTVVRAVDGTVAIAHSAGAAVNHGVSARDFDEPNAHIQSTSNPHSVTAAQAGALALTGGTVTGSTVVSTNTTTPALQITQTGTGNALVVEDSTSPDATPFVVTANGKVGIGTTSVGNELAVHGPNVTVRLNDTNTTNDLYISSDASGGLLNVTANQSLRFHTSNTERLRITSAGNVGIGTSSPGQKLDVVGNVNVAGSIDASTSTAYAPQFNMSNTTNDANATYIQLQKQRAGSAVLDGDVLGTLQWRGYDGSAYRNAAAIVAYVNGGPGSNDMPGRLSFQTSADGGSALTERMVISNAGLITGTGTSLGAWTAYTPTLGGTGWALGNGVFDAAYCQIGKTILFRISCVFGSTSTFGAGAAPTLLLPVSAKNSSTAAQSSSAMSVQYRDASTSNRYLGNVLGGTTAVTLLTIGTAGLTGAVISTAPFTWADTDQILVQGYYEAA